MYSGFQSPSALNGLYECINAFSFKEKKIYSVISYLLYFFALKKSYVFVLYDTLDTILPILFYSLISKL